MANQISNLDARMSYQHAVEYFAAAGFNTDSLKLSQSTLRLEQALTAGTSQFTFPVLSTETTNGVIFNTEKRLKLQDSFLVTQAWYYVALPASSTDTAFIPKTYVSGQVFTNVTDAVYSGFMECVVNKDVKITKWDLMRHYYAPQTQDSGQATPPQDELGGATYGFYPVEPNVIFVGSRDNVLTVTLDAPLATTDANARIGWYFRGLLAQNSTPVR